jgi:hypothetical protein
VKAFGATLMPCKSPLSIVLLLLLLSIGTLAKGQGICVISEIKISQIKGRISLPNGIPIPDASLELHEKTSAGRLVSKVKSNEEGRFIFENVVASKYTLIASYPTFVTLHVPVRVTGSKTGKNKSKEIVILLNALIDKPCGGGDAYLQRQEPAQKVPAVNTKSLMFERFNGL